MNHDTKLTNFDLTSFRKASSEMIATNERAYNVSKWGADWAVTLALRDYEPAEIERIINSNDLIAQQQLSRNYFYKDGLYRQIILHYATLLKYAGILIPNPDFGRKLSEPQLNKKYSKAMTYVDKMALPSFCTNCALKALIDGCYYGAVTQLTKTKFVVLDLPAQYCRSNFKDEDGNDLIEFNVSFFNTINVPEQRNHALQAYPEVIRNAYSAWKNHGGDNWVLLPSDIGVCFPLFSGTPLFLNVIPATIEYAKAIATEQQKDAEEIKKIIVQQIPHLTDGRLLFEPDEAAEIHKGTVAMMEKNPNVSVLTTYADVDSITSSPAAETVNSTLERMQNNVYAQAGVSGQLFASTGSNTLSESLKNDLSLMMTLAHKIEIFVTNKINALFGQSVTFKYCFLPVTYFNEEKYVQETFKLASSGYSWIIPAVALGLSQRDLGNLKDLENDILKLGDKLRPLTSAYTQSGDESVGRPKKEQDEKAAKTIQNEESLDNQAAGGSK